VLLGGRDVLLASNRPAIVSPTHACTCVYVRMSDYSESHTRTQHSPAFCDVAGASKSNRFVDALCAITTSPCACTLRTRSIVLCLSTPCARCHRTRPCCRARAPRTSRRNPSQTTAMPTLPSMHTIESARTRDRQRERACMGAAALLPPPKMSSRPLVDVVCQHYTQRSHLTSTRTLSVVSACAGVCVAPPPLTSARTALMRAHRRNQTSSSRPRQSAPD
jgi:hypothetical protein